jgi:3-isopropylmalate/(R)-2-methylmalate dehydratase small subunit
LPIVLKENIVDQIFREVDLNVGYSLAVNLEEQTVVTPAGEVHTFDIDSFRKENLLNGLDEIGLTLQYASEIKSFEDKRRIEQPWLFT